MNILYLPDAFSNQYVNSIESENPDWICQYNNHLIGSLIITINHIFIIATDDTPMTELTPLSGCTSPTEVVRISTYYGPTHSANLAPVCVCVCVCIG